MPFVIVQNPSNANAGGAMAGIGAAAAYGGSPYTSIARAIDTGTDAIARGIDRRYDSRNAQRVADEQRAKAIQRNTEFYKFAVQKHPELADDPIFNYEVQTGGDPGKALQFIEQSKMRKETANLNYDARISAIEGQNARFGMGLEAKDRGREDQQDFLAKQTESRQTFTAGQNDANRALKSNMFDQSMGFKENVRQDTKDYRDTMVAQKADQFGQRMGMDQARLDETKRYHSATEHRPSSAMTPEERSFNTELKAAQRAVDRAWRDADAFAKANEGERHPWLDRVAQQAEDDYSQKAQQMASFQKGQGQGAPKATPDQDFDSYYDSLPSGTIFTAPDGSTRRKP